MATNQSKYETELVEHSAKLTRLLDDLKVEIDNESELTIERSLPLAVKAASGHKLKDLARAYLKYWQERDIVRGLRRKLDVMHLRKVFLQCRADLDVLVTKCGYEIRHPEAYEPNRSSRDERYWRIIVSLLQGEIHDACRAIGVTVDFLRIGAPAALFPVWSQITEHVIADVDQAHSPAYEAIRMAHVAATGHSRMTRDCVDNAVSMLTPDLPIAFWYRYFIGRSQMDEDVLTLRDQEFAGKRVIEVDASMYKFSGHESAQYDAGADADARAKLIEIARRK